MEIAIIAAVFVLGAGIVGFVFPPTDEQNRPLAPEPGAGSGTHDDHGHHH